jgi:hypothetical protein
MIKNFHIKYVEDKDSYYLEGRLPYEKIVIPLELHAFEPIQFLTSEDSSKILLNKMYVNLNHPLAIWYLKTAGIIERDFSNYGAQLLNDLLSDMSPAQKTQSVNEILGRLRTLMPPSVRPEVTANIAENHF